MRSLKLPTSYFSFLSVKAISLLSRCLILPRVTCRLSLAFSRSSCVIIRSVPKKSRSGLKRFGVSNVWSGNIVKTREAKFIWEFVHSRFIYFAYGILKMQKAYVHCESKQQDTKLLPITSRNVNRFFLNFTGRFSGEFATNSYLNIPSHVRYLATLPCEISMFK